MKKVYFVTLLFMVAIIANATEIFVGPGQQYTTIQSAINATQNGDIVTVMNGTYTENIVITDKSITLRSNSGNANCIIDGNNVGHVIEIVSVNAEEETVTIQGFTIRNSGIDVDYNYGYFNDIYDSGIFVYVTSNTIIKQNKFINNFCDIYLKSTSKEVKISENSFNDITSTHFCARYIFCRSISEIFINDNQFSNSLTSNQSNGFIFCYYGDKLSLSNNDVSLCQGNFVNFRFVPEINIIDNSIEYSDYTLYAGGAFSFTQSNVNMNNNTIIYEDDPSSTAISCHSTSYTSGYFYNNVIANCERAIWLDYVVGSPSNFHAYIRNNTIYTCGTVFDIENQSSTGTQNNILEFKNNIIWDFTTMFELEYDLVTPITIEYSCLEGGIPTGTSFITGNGNTSNNPQLTTDYHLSSNSIYCIDLADPDTDNDGFEWQYDEDDRDVDGTRMDMGCYPYLHDYDTKVFTEGVHWLSFPILIQDGTYTNPLIPPVNNQIFQQAYYENGQGGLLQLTNNSPGTIDGFDIIEGNRYGTDMSIDPVLNNYGLGDENFDNMLFRHEGYKIKVGEVIEPTLLTVGNSNNDRLPSNHTIAGTMDYGEYHWIGYWLLESQNIVDAFGGNSSNPVDNLWQYVEKVKADDWYYDRCSINRGIGEPEPVSWITEGKTLEYGKMYMVWFKDQSIQNFKWYTSTTVEEPTKKAESEFFEYTEELDYEVIDVVDIPENIVEIGVFEEDTCVGAVVVEHNSEQILVYSDNANRDQTPFSFEIVTGSRGMNQPINNYLVFNDDSGEFEKGYVVGGRQESSIIKFGNISDPGNNNTPAIEKVQLFDNYPNPFNPETNISFSIPSEQKVQLTIYNLKGQKVRQLVNGNFASGKHSVVWKGKDDNGKQVSSGLYFYKLKTNCKEISKKMLLLK